MAAKRDNTPARWTLLLASGVAAAGFWLGIVTGPQPTQATPAPTTAVQSTSAPRQIQGQSSSGFASPSQQTQSAPQARIAAPRFRTRGS